MPDEVRRGIIGVGQERGVYARVDAKGMVTDVVVDASCDTDRAKRDLARDQYPDVAVYQDYLTMISSGDVDVIVTTVPHYLHPEMGIAALGSGIHALVDKPAGVYTKQVKELIAAAEATPELTFGIMFNQRMNPLYRRLKEV